MKKELKVIFIDEAQDISEVQFNFLTLLKEKLNCIMIMILIKRNFVLILRNFVLILILWMQNRP